MAPQCRVAPVCGAAHSGVNGMAKITGRQSGSRAAAVPEVLAAAAAAPEVLAAAAATTRMQTCTCTGPRTRAPNPRWSSLLRRWSYWLRRRAGFAAVVTTMFRRRGAVGSVGSVRSSRRTGGPVQRTFAPAPDAPPSVCAGTTRVVTHRRSPPARQGWSTPATRVRGQRTKSRTTTWAASRGTPEPQPRPERPRCGGTRGP